jgi:DNA-binding HxlR family transcriptional regulator
MNPIKFLCLICFLLFVLQAFNVYSQETEEYKVEFSVYDLYSRQEILSNFAKISASSKETESQLDFSFQNKNASEFNISFFLEEGRWDFKIEIDDFSSPALDYYIIHSLNLEDDITQNIYLLRVGSIKGIVKDNSDKLVSNAKIKFECERDDFIGILESDLFGTFSTKIAPEGNCKVYATYGDSVGISEVIVEKGKVSEVTVVLDQKVVFFDINNIITIILLSVLGIIFIVIIAKYLKSKTNKNQKEITYLKQTTQNENSEGKRKAEVEISSYEPEHKEDTKKSSEEQKSDEIVEIDYSFSGEKHHLSKRSIDILNSLSNGQKKVVEFLLEEGNHSSQARISRVGRIPKSTLHRYLSELEEKNIIRKKEDFNQNKVFLTDYFLSEK